MDYFTQVAFLSGLAVLVIQQILKLNFIPVAFANRYPVPTVILLSIIASIVAVWRTAVTPHGFAQWTAFVGLIVLTAAVTYNVTFKNWTQLRATEGEGK
jgi:hypothetical protein